MKSNFIRCGMYGWCMEVFWTGLHSMPVSYTHLERARGTYLMCIYAVRFHHLDKVP